MEPAQTAAYPVFLCGFPYALPPPLPVQVLSVAQDQNGCRFLQRKFDEGGAGAVAVVLPEVLDNIVELMVDPFGNYLIQKLLDRCSEQQRLEVDKGCPKCLMWTLSSLIDQQESSQNVLKRGAERGELVNVALNTHGTRAVQKLIETLSSREQRQIVIEALQGGEREGGKRGVTDVWTGSFQVRLETRADAGFQGCEGGTCSSIRPAFVQPTKHAL
eukprot:1160230-Pelagomonas_calceolata.AAC.4